MIFLSFDEFLEQRGEKPGVISTDKKAAKSDVIKVYGISDNLRETIIKSFCAAKTESEQSIS